jgi:hypothetical protein
MVSIAAGPASEQPRCTWCVPFWRGWGAMPDEVKGPLTKRPRPLISGRDRRGRVAVPNHPGKNPQNSGTRRGGDRCLDGRKGLQIGRTPIGCLPGLQARGHGFESRWLHSRSGGNPRRAMARARRVYSVWSFHSGGEWRYRPSVAGRTPHRIEVAAPTRARGPFWSLSARRIASPPPPKKVHPVAAAGAQIAYTVNVGVPKLAKTSDVHALFALG